MQIKKNIRFITAGVFTAVLLFSCDKDFLTEHPESFLTPGNSFESRQTARLALDGVYEALQDKGANRKGIYSFFVLEMLGTDITKCFAGNTNGGLSDYSFTAASPQITFYWEESYQLINRANLFLDNIDKVAMSDVLKNKYKGEALFLRSLIYFNLVRMFGDVPLPLTSATTLDPAVIQLPRSPVNTVYEQIIGDLEFAEQHLPDRDETIEEEKFRLGDATKDAARTVLAQLYLYRGSIEKRDGRDGKADFEKSKIYAQKVIDAQHYTLEPYFPDVWRKQDNTNSEVIFAVRYRAGAGGENSMIGVFLGVRGERALGGATNEPSVALFGTTYFEAGDTIRRKWTTVHGNGITRVNGEPVIIETTNNLQNAWGYGKWRQFPLRGPYLGEYGNQVPVLRLGDVYLVLAEAENELNHGPTQAAVDAVNKLRQRACNSNAGGVHADLLPRVLTANPQRVPDIALEDFNYEKFREYLFYERAREMASEWSRYFDLQRWGVLIETVKHVGSYVNPVTKRTEVTYLAAGNISEKHYLLPIPAKEIQANSKLTQNPGYN
ncbi:RagB/SusD family nutrient uptake outer membrane protein [Niabella aurantiaca]|uniref:RagB/SusD family nutrient uptake outer membrane protein n=1 Tax=Niabella aurantiaca TaxID=379900 RepID=UPI00037E5234|nr:RagB/SusD family nutrient uptake outer membrane protein [Niabella aurantiaca]